MHLSKETTPNPKCMIESSIFTQAKIGRIHRFITMSIDNYIPPPPFALGPKLMIKTYRVVTALLDDDPAGEALVVGVDP